MGELAGFAGILTCIAFWWLMTRSMKRNGRPWWLRHLCAALLAPLALLGGASLFGTLLGVPSADGEPVGSEGIITAIVLFALLSLPMTLSWRAAKRQSTAHRPNTHQPPISAAPTQPKVEKPVTQPRKASRAEPSRSLDEVLASNREAAREAVRQRRGKPSSALLTPPPSRSLSSRSSSSRPSPPRSVSSSNNLRFVYEDAQGNISTREVSSWRERNGYIEGVCLKANETRTFRRDRILDVLDGDDLLNDAPSKPVTRTEARVMPSSGYPEITFSGYDAKTRAELEKTATAYGFVVRQSVTKNLDYFVAGPRRSAAKLSDAEDKASCSVLDKEGFLWLVATGEVRA